MERIILSRDPEAAELLELLRTKFGLTREKTLQAVTVRLAVDEPVTMTVETMALRSDGDATTLDDRDARRFQAVDLTGTPANP